MFPVYQRMSLLLLSNISRLKDDKDQFTKKQFQQDVPKVENDNHQTVKSMDDCWLTLNICVEKVDKEADNIIHKECL